MGKIGKRGRGPGEFCCPLPEMIQYYNNNVYLFDFNFDQGGFASFILLSGIVVNAGLYIINDYNHFCRERNTGKNLKLYLKAYNHKIIPIFLTVVSTIIGLIPFVWAGQNEVFWFAFAFASGAMGGLLFSFIAVVVYLPLFLRFSRKFDHPTIKVHQIL